MIKLVAFLRRHPGLSREQFVARYERRHAALAASHMGGAARYVRRYLLPLDGPEAPPFDVITELWCENQDALEAVLAALSEPDVAAAIAKDETELFDRSQNPVFVVDEHDTDPAGFVAGASETALLS
jgi:uncharacterized protein (TIGR02118 family)